MAFMPEVLRALADEDPDHRTAACFAINAAAPLANFAQAAPEAFRGLAQLVGGTKAKRRDEKAKVAFEHAVAALLSLSRYKLNTCPPDIKAWSLVVQHLPLREDTDEAKKVHKVLVELVLEQNQELLGGADRANLGQVLRTLAEIHRMWALCSKDVDAKIPQIFKQIPREHLQALASGFTEKQQKKIEKMLLQ